MPNADPLHRRPLLLDAAHLVRTLEGLRSQVGDPADIWRRLTEEYVVDLDAVAALLPSDEPETIWLDVRN